MLIERVGAEILISLVEIIMNVSCKWRPGVQIKSGIIYTKLIWETLVVWHLPLVPHIEVQFKSSSYNSRISRCNHSSYSFQGISQTTKRLETRHFAVVAGEAP